MKNVLVIVFMLLVCDMVSAKCGSFIRFYPENFEVYKNTNIIIEISGGRLTSLVGELNKKYLLYLKSEQRKIKLRTKSLNEGQYGKSQIILELEEPLVGREIYELEIENLEEEYRRYFTNRYREVGKVLWLAKNESDFDRPKVIRPLKYSESIFQSLGCGPAVFSKFKSWVKDDSDIFIMTELAIIGEETSSKYRSFTNGLELIVGHGMCSGAFNFKKEKKYKIRFKYYDVCGNSNEEWSEWTACPNPLDNSFNEMR